MSNYPIRRRDFLKMAMAGAIVPAMIPGAKGETTGSETSASGGAVGAENATLLNAVEDTKALPDFVQREWLGPHFWGNRLQDWRLKEGRIECVSDEKGPDLRTVSVITRDLKPGAGSAVISATLGRISPKGKGFGGFLVGAGAGKLDYRAAALVQKASGEGGGLLCVVDTDGKAAFREHTSEDRWQEYKELPSKKTAGTVAYNGQPLTLTLQVQPGGSSQYRLRLSAKDGDEVVSTAMLEGMKEEDLLGGIMLVSAATSGPDGARYWFSNVTADGDKVGRYGERAVGPVLGTLFSLNANVMKMTAQLMPISASDPQHVTLEVRESGQAAWREVARQEIVGGYCATFRLDNWDDSKDWQYRVAYEDDGTGQGRKAYYEGTVRRDPRHAGRKLRIGLYSCTLAAARNLDGGGGRRQLPGSQDLGRYTPQCIYMPYTEIVEGSKKLNPDMLAFVGDQFYETNPTTKIRGENPIFDYLYKYYLWLWSYRDITRDRPTLVLVDDHDVYHGNLWGNTGREAPEDNQDLGGYGAASWVNMVQATQCGHNPDPYDPRPVQQGIGVYYCAFKFGGVEFCLLEDRKFKTAPIQGESLNVHVAELLGGRQEKFLKEWGEKVKSAEARICLTATLLGCAQTSPEGLAVVDFDSNGYPPLARIHAVRLLRDANVLILAGDQHLGSVIRLGDDTYTDGPIQFSGPAGSTSWTRWFEPAQPLANAGETPNTGDFQDGFGNKMRVLAVANPSITFKEYRKHIKGRGQGIGDRNLKAEGYGIVDVDLDSREYTLHCWRWDADPAAPGAKQYAGWPMRFGFDEVATGS